MAIAVKWLGACDVMLNFKGIFLQKENQKRNFKNLLDWANLLTILSQLPKKWNVDLGGCRFIDLHPFCSHPWAPSISDLQPVCNLSSFLGDLWHFSKILLVWVKDLTQKAVSDCSPGKGFFYVYVWVIVYGGGGVCDAAMHFVKLKKTGVNHQAVIASALHLKCSAS